MRRRERQGRTDTSMCKRDSQRESAAGPGDADRGVWGAGRLGEAQGGARGPERAAHRNACGCFILRYEITPIL